MRLRNDRREERKREGEARNEAWRALSPQQQLVALKRRPGGYMRQWVKLKTTIERSAT